MNKEHYEILKSGVAKWNAWRRENPAIAPDLSEANLTDVNLINANLTDSNLHEANLTDSNLFMANLRRGNLHEANLTDANLTDADLTGANLTDADLTGADLSNAALNWADLSSVYLTDADLSGADLSNAKLADTKGIFYTCLDPRGWVLVSWRHNGVVGFTAGCQSFESADLAKAHWGGAHYPDRRRGEMYCECVDFHLKQWSLITNDR